MHYEINDEWEAESEDSARQQIEQMITEDVKEYWHNNYFDETWTVKEAE